MVQQVLNQYEKTAAILISFGKEIAVEIIKRLPAQEAKAVLHAMSQIKPIDHGQLDAYIDEFYSLLNSKKEASALVGNHEIAHSFLTSTRASTDSNLADLQKSNDFQHLKNLIQKAPVKELSQMISREHPQTIAVILAFCGPKKAGDTVKYLNQAIRVDAILRLSKLESIPQKTIDVLLETFQQWLCELEKATARPIGGKEKISALLAALSQKDAFKMIDDIADADPDLAKELSRELYSMEKVSLLSSEEARLLISKLDRETLVISLRGQSEKTVKSFTNNMSTRAATMLQEDLQSSKKIKKATVEAAQNQVVQTLAELVENGLIVGPFSESS